MYKSKHLRNKKLVKKKSEYNYDYKYYKYIKKWNLH